MSENPETIRRKNLEEDEILDKEKLRSLNLTRTDLRGKWGLIKNGELVKTFDTQEEGIEFTRNNLPKGSKAMLSKIGEPTIKKIYKKSR
jgi:hypothetical protein